MRVRLRSTGLSVSGSPVNLALTAGLTFIPLVVAIGLMTDRGPVPESLAGIDLSALRTGFDDTAAGDPIPLPGLVLRR